jgi:hypothetical protein
MDVGMPEQRQNPWQDVSELSRIPLNETTTETMRPAIVVANMSQVARERTPPRCDERSESPGRR